MKHINATKRAEFVFTVGGLNIKYHTHTHIQNADIKYFGYLPAVNYVNSVLLTLSYCRHLLPMIQQSCWQGEQLVGKGVNQSG